MCPTQGLKSGGIWTQVLQKHESQSLWLLRAVPPPYFALHSGSTSLCILSGLCLVRPILYETHPLVSLFEKLLNRACLQRWLLFCISVDRVTGRVMILPSLDFSLWILFIPQSNCQPKALALAPAPEPIQNTTFSTISSFTLNQCWQI